MSNAAQSGNSRTGPAILIGALIVVICLVLIAWGLATKDTPAKADAGDSSRTVLDLTVKPGDIIPEHLKCTKDELRLGQPQWSDGVTDKFSSAKTEEMIKEVYAENCTNPTFLIMNVEALADLKVGDIVVGDIPDNAWMREFISSAKADVYSLLTKKKDAGDTIFVTSDFQAVAGRTNLLLSRFTVAEKTGTWKTISNWRIAPDQGLGGGIPLASLNPQQYKGEFLRLEYTQKAVSCPLVAIGFNTGDKRFAELPLDCGEKPKPTPTPTPEKPTPTPTPTPDDPKPKKVQACNVNTKKAEWVTKGKENTYPYTTDWSKCKDTPPPPPPEVCKWDPKLPPNDPNCTEPKSDDPDDYTYPEDKPSVPPVTTPPDTNPPKVETEKPGGRGVTDSPTKKPGSETGVTAPGATPAPTQSSTPPPNQGGTTQEPDAVAPSGDPGGF